MSQVFITPLGGAPGPTVAVTGGSGFVGRRVVPLLREAGCRVRLLGRSANEVADGVEVVRGDLSDALALSELVNGADALVHMAGVAHTRLDSAEDVQRARLANLDGSCRLFELASAAGVRRLVFLSSAHVYKGQQGTGLTETAETAGDGLYAELKLGAENAARLLQSEQFRVAILRPPLVYGGGARFNLASLMRSLRGGYYVHPGGADAERSMVAVHTLARAVLHMLESETGSATWNVADEKPVSLRSWVNRLAELLDAPKPRTVPFGVLRAAASVGSALRAMGVPAPLTLGSLSKLTTPFSLDVRAIESTGFVCRGHEEQDLAEMARSFRESQ